MKKLLLVLLFITYYSTAQHVQIDFVQDFFITIINPVPLSPSEGNGTTNSEINTIFTTHNVSNCYTDSGYPEAKLFAVYTGNNIGSFIADLESNPNVSKVAQTAFPYTYSGIMYIQFASGIIVNPTGTDIDGNIITTNEDLNLIFSNYQVKMMSDLTTNHYQISFEGNINLLKNALEALENIIVGTDFIGVPMLLSNETFNSKSIAVFPNPFIHTINIETSEIIANYLLFDISGKQILNSNSKNNLDTACNNLTPGVYLLKLESETGQIFNQKIIKN